MKKLIIIIMLGVTVSGHAQWAVSDGATHTLTTQQTIMEMEKWADQLSKMNQQLNQAQRMIDVAGDPAQAVGAVGAVAGVNTSSASGITSTFSAAKKLANAGQSLYWTGNNTYKAIPQTLPDGTQIVRNMDNYKSYAAFETAYDRYTTGSERLKNSRDLLLRDIETVQARPASTETAQREKQARLVAMNAQLAALDQERKQLSEDVAAQRAANEEQRAKQNEASAEEAYTRTQKALRSQ